MLKNLLCKKSESLINAWKIINKNGKGIVFIIDDNMRLLGLLTDGDIRNYFLSNNSISVDISKVMNKDFVYAKEGTNANEILKLFNERIKIVPIVNSQNEIIDYTEFNRSLYIPAAIPDLKGKEFEYLTDAFLSTWISSTGKYINQFEENFSTFCNVDYGVAVSNGTVAIQLALDALGIGEGDEVVVPDLTFAATINAVLHRKAKPVIVDIEETSWCICPNEIEKAISPKTKAIIPVHLYGQVCDMNAIMSIAKKNDLYVIEDCAEAHGAEWNNQKVGSMGDIGCFSFFANKVITTGEGGMCITNSADLNDKMKILRDHGMDKKKRYWHNHVGYNFRMTNLQAAIGVAQLERINSILDKRRKIEKQYFESLKNIDGVSFQHLDLINRKKITWFVNILIEQKRDEVIQKLQDKLIDARPFFYPLSEMDIYKEYVFSNKISKHISQIGINLPAHSQINEETIDVVKQVLISNQ